MGVIIFICCKVRPDMTDISYVISSIMLLSFHTSSASGTHKVGHMQTNNIR